ncbi:MAG: histidine kinase N-terminal 7TM domain-containing protein [Chloroflexota bacterium]
MQLEYSIYILPLLASGAISAWVAWYALSHRRATAGALMLGILALSITEWTLGYMLEIAGADLPTKLFWGKVQYIGIATAPLMWLLFALYYSNPSWRLTPRNLLFLIAIPLVTIALIFTNEAHHLIWTENHINNAGAFSTLGVSYGPWFWVHSAFSYLALLAGAVLILRSIGRAQNLYREQAVALLVAVVAPWVGNVLYLSGLSPIAHLDPTPFAFTITTVAVAWGILGFRLIDLLPLARDTVVEEMQDGMIILDQDGRIADANPAALRLIGSSATQTIGQSVATVFGPWPQIVERFKDTKEGLEEVSIGEGPDKRWYELHISALADKRQHLIGRVITIRKITDRKQAEQFRQAFLDDMHALQEIHLALSEIEELPDLYVKIVELSQQRLGLDRVGLLMLDPSTNQLYGTYGIDPDGQIRDESYYHEPIGDEHWTLEVLGSPGRTKLWENAPILDNGEMVGTGWKVASALWNGRQAIGYLVCDNFITRKPARPYETELVSLLGTTFGHLIERKRAEEKLRQLSRAVEASPTSIVITDTQGRIQYANPKFTEVTGYTLEEALGQNPRILKTEYTPVEVHQQLWETLAAGDEWRGEFCNRKKNGDLYWEFASISPIIDSTGSTTHYVAVKEDITEQRQVREQLVIARDQALEASRLKSQLLANVSHELRTPLGGILGYIELLHDGAFGALNESQERAAANIMNSANYLNTLISELLNQAQIDARTVLLHMEQFSPTALLQSVEAQMSVLAHNKGLAFTAELSADLPDELYGDLPRLQQILINLAGNAIKFTKTGEVCLKLYQPKSSQWAMQVSDTGIGIPAEAQAYIFEPFRQVDTNITSTQRGIGLGLPITQQLVELMEGSISLESEVGQGSIFTVLLPLITSPEKTQKAEVL